MMSYVKNFSQIIIWSHQLELFHFLGTDALISNLHAVVPNSETLNIYES